METGDPVPSATTQVHLETVAGRGEFPLATHPDPTCLGGPATFRQTPGLSVPDGLTTTSGSVRKGASRLVPARTVVPLSDSVMNRADQVKMTQGSCSILVPVPGHWGLL